MQAAIVPVQVWPGFADRLYVRAGNLGPPPSFFFELQTVTPTPAVPAVAGKGFPGEPGYEPAQEEISAGEKVEPRLSGNVSMTEEQWDRWEAAAAGKLRAEISTDDESYILAAVARNLGLELAKN